MTQPHEKKQYDTGAVRSNDCESTRYDLISPIGLEALARTYAEGAAKFGAFNWENGMPVGDLLNHAIAHVYKFLRGDRSEDHLAHAAWNLLGAIHSLERWPHLNENYLRGPNCECPKSAAVANIGDADLAEEIETAEEIEIAVRDFAEVAPHMYAVDLGCEPTTGTTTTTASSDLGPSLDALKRAIFDAENEKAAENKPK